MAAPFAAGTAALIKATNPTLTATQLKACLIEAAVSPVTSTVTGQVGPKEIWMPKALGCAADPGGGTPGSGGVTRRVSVASDGTQTNGYSYFPAVSGDGRYITYYSYASNLVAGDTNGTHDVFVWDAQTGSTRRVSVATDGTQANESSYEPAVSGDGRYITYHSAASNLVAGDTNGTHDVFVWDREG